MQSFHQAPLLKYAIVYAQVLRRDNYTCFFTGEFSAAAPSSFKDSLPHNAIASFPEAAHIFKRAVAVLDADTPQKLVSKVRNTV